MLQKQIIHLLQKFSRINFGNRKNLVELNCVPNDILKNIANQSIVPVSTQ